MCAISSLLSAAPARADNMLAYLTHVGAGELRLLWSRESPTPERLAALPPAERAGYEAFQSALAFGESLGLAHTTSYRQLSDTGHDWLVQVVTAAPANKLDPITWWFPIIGSVSYRGYFDPERAQRFAVELAARDLDVYVRPSPLYTTLGWFEDALPRSLLAWPEEDLIDTALHEQLHLTVYIESDVAYNEGLATFTAHRATTAYLRDRPEIAERARASFADELTYARMLNALRAELEPLYTSNPTPAEARARRAPIFARYQGEVYAAQPWQTQRFAGFQKIALSNAWLVGHRDYIGLAPCFERELAELGGDLAAFVRAHREKPGHRPPGCEATQ